MQGEAAVIDLGARGLLFATLSDEERLRSSLSHLASLGCQTPFPRQKFSRKYDPGRSPNDEYADYFDELNKQKPRRDVPFKSLPMFVRFHDPASVERVDPSDLAASFGAGVKLEGMSVEISDAPVSKRIELVVLWLAPLHNQLLLSAPPWVLFQVRRS